MVPTATRVAVLVDSTSPTAAEAMVRDVEPAARAIGLQIHAFNAGQRRDQCRLHNVCARTDGRGLDELLPHRSQP
jgi:hypothetical protein